MIEPTAVILGPCDIDESVYVGHFTILGGPNFKRGFGRDEWQVKDGSQHWTGSRGVRIEAGATIGGQVVINDGTKIGLRTCVNNGVHIGHDVIVGEDVEFYYKCEVSNRVTIGDRTWVGGFICNDVVIGTEAVVFGSLIHRFVDGIVGVPEAAPQVEDGAFVGMGAIVIGGITVGAASYIAAGSVLTHNAAPGRLYKGNPAQEVGPAPKAFHAKDSREFPPLSLT